MHWASARDKRRTGGRRRPCLTGVDIPVGTQMQRTCPEDLDRKDKGDAVRLSSQRGFSEPEQCWELPEAVTLKLRPKG